MASYVVKAQFEGSLRRFSLSGVSYGQLESQVRDLFKILAGEQLVLTYVDSDGDAVTMAEDADLHDALVLQSLNPLRLKATVLKKEAGESAVRSEIAAEAQQQRKDSSEEKKIPLEKADAEERRNVSVSANLSAKTDTEALGNVTRPSADEGVRGRGSKDRSESERVKAPDADAANSEESKQPVHFGVVCDDCGTRNIQGTRYKSLRRYNYDLCETCFQKPGVDCNHYIAVKKARPDGRSMHFNRRAAATGCDSRNMNFGIHRRAFENAANRRGRPRCGGGSFGNPGCGFERTSSTPAPRADREVTHPGVTCDKCGVSPIIGPRFKSTKRFNYDLCQNCVHKIEGAAVDEYTRIDQPRHEAHPCMLWKSKSVVSPARGPCPFVTYGRPRSPRRVLLVAMMPETAETHGEHQSAATEAPAGEGSSEIKQVSKPAANSPGDGNIAADAEETVQIRKVEQQHDDAKEKTTSIPVNSASNNSDNAQEVQAHAEQTHVTAKDDGTPVSQTTVSESVAGSQSHADGLDMKPSASNEVVEKQSTNHVLPDEKKVLDEDTFADDWDPILEELQEMGFYDSDLNRRVLSQNEGSMKRTVKELVGIEKMGRSKASKGE